MISSTARFGTCLKRQTSVIVFLALVLAGGCARSPSPEPAAGPDFPDERYLKAVAEGKTLPSVTI
ncbi:MAG: hypothetical protein HUK40_11220 [Desulfobacter sp.]|nr:hypothetical protein [Desulfobacter sp.]WDP84088.1 MAG: hypothetical protein HUN05_02035 [Desulfobacter sp.]